MKIKALRQFSHYHLGTVDQDEVRNVPDAVGRALVGMDLAEEMGGGTDKSKPVDQAAKPAPKRRGRAAS
ncbi:hypothetical protein RAN3_1887 [plant metagenome]|uniref:Uncharacterized protein n=1 Tax=plant metagenome TaxID=1297885 RepID=A0A484VCJ3_9ZZZZ